MADELGKIGVNTPEYESLLDSSVVLKSAITPRFYDEAERCRVVPQGTDRRTDVYVREVKNEVQRDPRLYYVLQYVIDESKDDDRFHRSTNIMESVFSARMNKFLARQVAVSAPGNEPGRRRVFLSYAWNVSGAGNRVDAKPSASLLYTELDRREIETWKDDERMRGGDLLENTVFSAVQQCDVFIPIITCSYAESLWCLREFYFAILGNKVIIPWVLENVEVAKAGKWVKKRADKILHYKADDMMKLVEQVVEIISELSHPPSGAHKMSDECSEFIASVKGKYRQRCIGRDKQWPTCHSDKLVRLELVERKKGEGYSANEQRGRKSKGTKRTSLAYGDLFKVESGKRPVRKVLVEGDAGIGKTTFCIAVSEDWANGKLFQQFELVLLLPLRIKAVASAGILPDLLKLLHSNPRLRDSVASYLEVEEGGRVLIIADGWDELSESNRQEGSFLYQLLFQLFPLISVVVTSRPYASAPLCYLPDIDRFVEVRGFSEEHIVDYIQSEFASDQEKAGRLLEQLEDNPLIESVCSVPLNCTIVSYLWDTLEGALPTTMTQLYKKIIDNIALRNMHKLDSSVLTFDSRDIPNDFQKSWWHLCELAFQALEKDQLVFSPKELKAKGLALDEGIRCFGLLQTVELVGFGISFHFPHRTIQEYLAALHLARLEPDKQLEVFRSYNTKGFVMVWRFFFGINDFNKTPNYIQQFFGCVADEGDDEISLSVCHCVFESHSVLINNEVTQYILHRDLYRIDFGTPRTAHDCAAILYVLANISECDDDILIYFSKNCDVKENQIIELLDILASKEGKLQITYLDLSGSRLTVSSLQALESAVHRNLLHRLDLLELVISNTDTNVAQLTSLLDTLSVHCPHIGYLSFSDSNLGVPGVSVISKIWDHSTCSLDLSSNHLGDEGMAILCEHLENVHVPELRLECNHIHVSGVSHLVDTICSGKAAITDELSLAGNPLGLEGTKAVGRMLSSSHCKVNDVLLFDCELTTAGGSDSLNLGDTVSCEAVGQQLCQMPQNSAVGYIDLSDNSFTVEGIHILAGLMHLCPHISTVHTRNCGITSDDLEWLLDRLAQLKSSSPSLCSKLVGWFLRDNQIDNSGVSTLLNHLPSLFPRLGSVDLDNNQVNSELMKKLNEECRRRKEVCTSLSSQLMSASQQQQPPPSNVSDQYTRLALPPESNLRGSSEVSGASTCTSSSLPLHTLSSTLPLSDDTQCHDQLEHKKLRKIGSTQCDDQPEEQVGGSGSDTESDTSLDLQPPLSKRHKRDLADEHCFVDLVKWEDEKGVKRELRIYSKIAHKWRQIATRLGFEPEEIESIDAECRTRYSRITAVLERWFENAKKLANASRYSQSWEGLIKLLEDTELGKVAVELQKALSSPKNSVRGNL